MECNHQCSTHGSDSNPELLRTLLEQRRLRNPLLLKRGRALVLKFKGQYDFFYTCCEYVYQASTQGFFDINVFLGFTAKTIDLRNLYALRFTKFAIHLCDDNGKILTEWSEYTRPQAEELLDAILSFILDACNVHDFPAYKGNGVQCLNHEKRLDAVHQYASYDLPIHVIVERCKQQTISGKSIDTWPMP